MRWSHRLFRLLLLAYPIQLRREHGGEMWLTFERHLREARSHGRLAVVIMWWREILGALHSRNRARIATGRGQRLQHPVPPPYRPRRFNLGVSWLDFKLAFRMLVRYPGLTFVGGLAIAFAIGVGAGAFEFIGQVLYPTLPLPDGNRIVAIRNWNVAAGRTGPNIAFDFAQWQEDLQSVQDLGAYRVRSRNLLVGDGLGEPVEVAEMSASAFRIGGVAPLIGRSLVPSDEGAGAPTVVVLGHDVWRTRFAADPEVVGRVVRLGVDEATVVGVMPAGFAFPYNPHLWVPSRLDASTYEPGEGPSIRVFGKLRPGASLAEAQAELTTLGRRIRMDYPATHEHLRPQVLPYAKAFLDLSATESLGLLSINLFIVMLLVLVCGNVALLMFARAASRQSEIAVRSALGASRRRITTQLFVEALVLAGVGAAVGLAAARAGLRWGLAVFSAEAGGDLPFWINHRLSPTTLLYIAGLTILGAMIAGVVPALKVTALQQRLRRRTAGGGGLKFGGLWTVVIVAQVAVTVAFPAFGFFVRRDVQQIQSVHLGFSEDEYLTARLDLDREAVSGTSADTSRAAFGERFGSTIRELEGRLTAEPAVAGVTFGTRLPRMYHPANLVEVDEGGAAPLVPPWPGYRVSSASVAIDFFDVLDTPISFGRGFHPGDLEADPVPVIVNESFVERVLDGRNPIGRRLRYTHMNDEAEPLDEPGPWHEIVGVVRDLGMAIEPDPKVAGIYHPIWPGEGNAHVAVHVRGDPTAFAPTLREIATRVDPTLRLSGVMPLSETITSDLRFYAFWFWLTVLISGVAMLLSLAGIYAVMAFTVARRTREIGIRVALGSDARRIALAIFRRPLTQVAVGVLIGGMLTAALSYSILRGTLWPTGVAVIVVYAAMMMGVCLLACILPTRRALTIQPSDALREENG